MMEIIEYLMKKKDQTYSFIRNEFDRHPIAKFVMVLILLVAYFIFAAFSHGLKEGLLISLLTWSFFVLCTPLADGGILIDFPMRLITGIKMVYSEIIVWIIAIGLNIITVFTIPEIYDKTIILSLFKHILVTPLPLWIIIILSGVGTFISLYLADKLIDSRKKIEKPHHLANKYKWLMFIFIIVLILIIYHFLLNSFNANIPLI